MKNVSMQMKSNTATIVLVYHPNCRFSKEFRAEWIKLAFDVYRNNRALNVVAINDGFAPELRKQVPGYEIKYYPTVLLYRNGSALEFNQEDQT